MSEENLPRHFRCETAPDRLFFRLKYDDEPPSSRNGRVAEPGSVSIARGSRPVDDRADGASRWRSMSTPVTALAAAAETLLHRSLSSLLHGADYFHPAADTFGHLAFLQQEALRLVAQSPDALDHPVAARALDEQITQALLAMLGSAASPRDTAAARRHHAIMRRLAGFIEANEARPVAVSELCKVAACSTKVLEHVFVEFFGQTPNRHLRLRRLWGTRRALLAAHPRSATVSGIALDWGFWELGRFAVAYRHAFGETPSQTLRRVPPNSMPRDAYLQLPRLNRANSA